MIQFLKDAKDTVTVGLDYYALTGISARFVPEGVLKSEYYNLSSGRVVIYRAVLEGDKIRFFR